MKINFPSWEWCKRRTFQGIFNQMYIESIFNKKKTFYGLSLSLESKIVLDLYQESHTMTEEYHTWRKMKKKG